VLKVCVKIKPMNLKDQVILITGASSGLGKALALRLAKEGVKLALLARSKKRLAQVKKKIKPLGCFCEYFVCDVVDKTQVDKVIKGVVKKFGSVDVLINNAGIWYEGPTEKHPPQKIKELFAVNSIGPIFLIQAVLPIMKKKKTGQILNIVSTAGVEPSGQWGVYTATKYAVRGFTDSLKLELQGMGIKVMGFYLGGMDTELFTKAGFPKKDEPWMLKKEDVAEIIAFILKRPGDVVMNHVEVRKMMK